MADTSGITAALPQTTQQNPLQTFSSVIGIQNDMARNRLLQQGLLNSQQELQNLQLTNQTGQTNLAQTKRVNAGKALYALNNQDDDGMMANAPTLLEGLRSDNNITDSMYEQVKTDIANKDVKALRTHLNNGLIATLSGPEALQAVRGTTRLVTLPSGQTQQVLDPGVLSPPGTPTQNLGSPAGGGLSPAEATDVVRIPQASGADVPVTRGQIAAGTAPGLGGSEVPNEVQKTAAVNSQTNATNAVGQISSQAWNDQQQSLASVLNLSDKALAGKGTGPISDLISVASNVIPGIHPGVDAVATNTALLAKSLERQALSSGNRSDADLFAKIAANPNLGMTPEAIRHATRYVLALNLQEKVLVQEAANKASYKPLDPKTFYEQQRLAVQNGLDQNAFVHTYLPDDGSYYAGLSSSGKDRYDNTRKLIQQYSTPSASLKAVQ